jgi:hypothetical protein
VAREWGGLCAHAHRAGRPIGILDAFFAATAKVHGLTLVTRNVGHFTGTGVQFVDPWTLAI